jgi:hypothetical protein
MVTLDAILAIAWIAEVGQMSDAPRSDKATMASDIRFILPSLLGSFGLIGLVDTAIAWKDFFTNFFTYWNGFIRMVFFIVPFEISDTYKNIIVINISFAGVAYRARLLISRQINNLNSEDFSLKSVFFMLLFSSAYASIFLEFLAPMRDYITSQITSILHDEGLFGIALRAAVDTAFAIPLFITPFAVFGEITNRWKIHRPLKYNHSEYYARVSSNAFLVSLLMMVGCAGAILLFCAKI